MTTGSLGQHTDGWAPLYVIETTTNQIGVYRLQFQGTPGGGGRPTFELVQRQAYAEPIAANIAEDKVGATCSLENDNHGNRAVLVRYDDATKAPIPLDALYILDNRTGRPEGITSDIPSIG